MTDLQLRQLDALARALNYLGRYESALTPEIRAIRDSLNAYVDRIRHLAAEQHLRGAPAPVAHCRPRANKMREEMLKLAGSARRAFRGMPVSDQLGVPHKRAPIDELLRGARALCAALEPETEFLRQERVDVRRIGIITRAADEIEASLRELEAIIPKSQLATKELPPLFKAAMEDKATLDRLVSDVPGMSMSTWRSTSRVSKRMGRPSKRRGKKANRSSRAAKSDAVL